MADPEMDEFAQTRGDDDLFDDEIIPVSAQEQQTQTEAIAPEPEPVPAPVPDLKEVPEKPPAAEKPSPRGETPQRGRGGERGRGRRNRGRGGRGGRESDSKRSESSQRRKAPAPAIEAESHGDAGVSKPEKAVEASKEQSGEVKESDAEANGAEAQRVPAVRGDRSATGGLRKPKLTEEELSKRIAAAKENAVKKAAAHARAEADQASFVEREQVAAKKRREELAHRRVMDNEREQNRQRKLKAQTGREWDSQKREEDYNPRGGGSQFRRGMHGGVSGYARRDLDGGRSEDTTDHADSQRGRGRGGRGGRGRGSPREPRGERPSKGLSDSKYATPSPATPGLDKSDFPALPEGTKKPEAKPESEKIETTVAPATAPAPSKSPATLEKLDSTFSPITGTWADQFEDDE
ncbi:hypothetical protein N7499_011678 [Penicillium canescens]|uniref:Uncharacterized protein n=1 Tax=Penicillium canescens TaxID=5083 RepID=A0AAD6IKR1_PENCN|nr:uncharacterized protein N7446_006939 [Penicillium canescens]KAJ6049733.1 hypothetical protein N7444_006449 [Penicillium canescens]KAJ6052296.1 hypothetical protein N7460_002830 [Penicillium canescens]KAJ6062819.1 hypothetical protein N7446_006939 [Penicillium canescens]KAJ6069791.1 hypothetical protein N7499_011678 [Penicillium canescens]KAJ6182157.1 hypothetical protein N7485_000799 [Penicillium canescens]